jgi:probable HAF family extracellular repeat protein
MISQTHSRGLSMPAPRPTTRFLIHLALIAASLQVSASAASGTYTVLDLGKFPGGSAIPLGINSTGAVVGRAERRHGGEARAFIWMLQGGTKLLGVLPGGDSSTAFAINDSAQVVGSSNTQNQLHAFQWTAARRLVDLGTLPGDTDSEAFGINNPGQIVGYSSGPSGQRAFITDASGVLQNLGTLPGDNGSQGNDINDAGTVVGVSSNPEGTHAFRWTKAGGMQELPTPVGETSAVALRINNAGQVLGRSTGLSGLQAVLWQPDGSPVLLGTLPGGNYSEAFGINESGQVVGTAGSVQGSHAFVWTAANGLQDLNNLLSVNPGVVLVGALSINEKGVIVAYGSRLQDLKHAEMDDEDHAANHHVFLLTPVP